MKYPLSRVFNMYQILAYIKFIFTSSNQHGVHSPFVYNLITQCFYDQLSKTKKLNFLQRLLLVKQENNSILIPKNYQPKRLKQSVYPKIKRYRNNLLSNKNTLSVTDFGAGSNVFKSNERAIFKIAKIAGITQKRAELLARLIAYFNIESILELGTSLGIATASMAFDNPKTKITTIEGCPETAKIAQQQFKKYQLNNINSIVTDFSEFLTNNNQKYDLIYIDGNHQKEPTLAYFNSLLKNIQPNTIFIFDDIHWSQEMEEAWNEIKNHQKVTLTIDTFYWGFVFFRTENLQPEHFKIRV